MYCSAIRLVARSSSRAARRKAVPEHAARQVRHALQTAASPTTAYTRQKHSRHARPRNPRSGSRSRVWACARPVLLTRQSCSQGNVPMILARKGKPAAKVKFADRMGAIACVGQEGGQQGCIGVHLNTIGPDAMIAWEEARKHRGPRRHADRVGAIGAFESHPFRCDRGWVFVR